MVSQILLQVTKQINIISIIVNIKITTNAFNPPLGIVEYTAINYSVMFQNHKHPYVLNHGINTLI